MPAQVNAYRLMAFNTLWDDLQKMPRANFILVLRVIPRELASGKYPVTSTLLTDAVSQMDFEFVPGQPRILTQEYHSVFIHKGEAFSNDDTIIHFLSKLIINSNGEVTTTTEIQNVECQ